MYNTVCHVEFAATDMARSQSFYGALFGWKFSAFGPEMVVFGTEEAHVGALVQAEAVTTGSSPSVWFRVLDLDETVSRAATAGGSVDTPKHEVPGVGWSAVVRDPDGNPVGLVQYREGS